MHPLTRRVERTIRAHGLLGAGDRVAVALSGGADSVALAWVLRDLAAAPGARWTAAGLIHVNHGLRGDEAARDETFCRALATRLGWPIEVTHVDVAADARDSRRSLEAAARAARYRFFPEAAQRLHATRIATAHTEDDQAETVLLRLLRGSGARGVAGIRLARGPYIRPLLECRRADVRRFLASRREPFCEDSSNLDQTIARNRIRHQLLPLIERIAPGGVEALARFASLSAGDEAYLSEVAIDLAASVVSSSEGGVQLECGAPQALPAAVARRVVRLAVEQAAPGAACAARHFEAIRGLAGADKPSGHLDLPSLAVDRQGGRLTLHRATRRPRADRNVVPLRPLAVPGSVEIPECGLLMSAAAAPSTANVPLASGRGDTAVIQAASVALPLAVRTRREGDRIRPMGAPGRRKIQDVFVDRKVSRQARDRVPIVVDAAGRIVWVVGHALAEECRVTAPAAGVVILKVQSSEAKT